MIGISRTRKWWYCSNTWEVYLLFIMHQWKRKKHRCNLHPIRPWIFPHTTPFQNNSSNGGVKMQIYEFMKVILIQTTILVNKRQNVGFIWSLNSAGIHPILGDTRSTIQSELAYNTLTVFHRCEISHRVSRSSSIQQT